MSCWSSGHLQPYQDALEASPCPVHSLLSPSSDPSGLTRSPRTPIPHFSCLYSLPHYLPNLACHVLQSLFPSTSPVSCLCPTLLSACLPPSLSLGFSVDLHPFDSLSSCLSCLAATVSLNPFHLSVSTCAGPSSLVPVLPNPPWLTFRKSRVKPWSRLWRPRKPEELSWASASWIGAAVEGCTETEGSSKRRTSACHIAGQAGRLWNA